MFLKFIFLSMILLTSVSVTTQETPPPFGDTQYISPEARLERLFNDGLVLTESPAEGPDGLIYFSDITFTTSAVPDGVEAGHFWRFDPQSVKTTIFRSPSGMSNGIKFDGQGRLIAAEGADHGGRRITRTDMTTGKSYILASKYNGRPLNAPNDITIDEMGRIYFSDPKYIGYESVEQPVMAVYRIDIDGSIHRIITDAGKPNGVAISPNQKTLYVVSNDNGSMDLGKITPEIPVTKGRMALLAYDLKKNGTATFRRVLVNYLPEDGPDGLVVDIEGNLYVAERNVQRPGISIRDPQGIERAFIPTKVLPTNVGFGRGNHNRILYITAGKGLYRISVKKPGYHLPKN